LVHDYRNPDPDRIEICGERSLHLYAPAGLIDAKSLAKSRLGTFGDFAGMISPSACRLGAARCARCVVESDRSTCWTQVSTVLWHTQIPHSTTG